MATSEERRIAQPWANAEERTPKVLFIVGWDRSGSTILDLVLGAVDGFFAVGELHHLWRRGIVEERLCGCGKRPIDCPVWAPILQEIYGHIPDREEARSVVNFRKRALRVRSTWRILRHRGRGLDAYLPLMARTYRAAAAVANASVIVDASKDPSDAAVLTLLPAVEPYFVHLVRDPRATAFSFTRRQKRQPDTRDGTRMPRQGVVESTRNWLVWNIAAERVREAVPPDRWTFLRYEDFVADPAVAIERIVRFIGEDPEQLPFVDATTARVGGNHTVSGNPARFADDTVTIRDDDEWRRQQSIRDRSIASAVALPRLRRYGYPLVGTVRGDGRPAGHGTAGERTSPE
jgi:hypothetical protein